METIPVSDEVSDLVEKLGSFYTEVDGEDEPEETEVEKRPYTRPFAKHSGTHIIRDTNNNSTLRGISKEGEKRNTLHRGHCCSCGVWSHRFIFLSL